MNHFSRTEHKIVSLELLQKKLTMWRLLSKKIVFTNGCFDILHRGHIHLLSAAKDLGDILIVGLNSDSSVSHIKPNRPLQDEISRGIVLSSLGIVDAVIVFNED